jgi:EAL domain-containing protein (putative c-di-GMP-specific phosphodiesterase class I)
VLLSREQSRQRRDRRAVRRLRTALARDELEVHYQPKVQVHTGLAVGVEALLRWRHPARGLMSPGEFLPAVEHDPVMGELAAYVIDAALRQASAWREEGKTLSVAVNLSPTSLLDPDLGDTIHTGLRRWDVPPELLVLEITETAVLADPEGTARILREVAGLGVTISLDDFGTGHSSLSRLLQLPIGEVKIDRRFVRDMTRDAAHGTVVSAIVALAHDLGHRVVAEGVEDRETVGSLADLGCDEAQGYFICHPVPVEELPPWAVPPGWA